MRFGRVRHAPLTPTSSKRQIRRYQNKVNESLTADLRSLARRGLRTVSPRTKLVPKLLGGQPRPLLICVPPVPERARPGPGRPCQERRTFRRTGREAALHPQNPGKTKPTVVIVIAAR